MKTYFKGSSKEKRLGNTRLNNQGSIPRRGKTSCLHTKTGSETNPPSYVMGGKGKGALSTSKHETKQFYCSHVIGRTGFIL
jgi:hypothetical protein